MCKKDYYKYILQIQVQIEVYVYGVFFSIFMVEEGIVILQLLEQFRKCYKEFLKIDIKRKLI